jgi:hypothetical protein
VHTSSTTPETSTLNTNSRRTAETKGQKHTSTVAYLKDKESRAGRISCWMLDVRTLVDLARHLLTYHAYASLVYSLESNI